MCIIVSRLSYTKRPPAPRIAIRKRRWKYSSPVCIESTRTDARCNGLCSVGTAGIHPTLEHRAPCTLICKMCVHRRTPVRFTSTFGRGLVADSRRMVTRTSGVFKETRSEFGPTQTQRRLAWSAKKFPRVPSNFLCFCFLRFGARHVGVPGRSLFPWSSLLPTSHIALASAGAFFYLFLR